MIFSANFSSPPARPPVAFPLYRYPRVFDKFTSRALFVLRSLHSVHDCASNLSTSPAEKLDDNKRADNNFQSLLPRLSKERNSAAKLDNPAPPASPLKLPPIKINIAGKLAATRPRIRSPFSAIPRCRSQALCPRRIRQHSRSRSRQRRTIGTAVSFSSQQHRNPIFRTTSHARICSFAPGPRNRNSAPPNTQRKTRNQVTLARLLAPEKKGLARDHATTQHSPNLYTESRVFCGVKDLLFAS